MRFPRVNVGEVMASVSSNLWCANRFFPGARFTRSAARALHSTVAPLDTLRINYPPTLISTRLPVCAVSSMVMIRPSEPSTCGGSIGPRDH